MASIEEKVEEQFKKELDDLGIRHYGKTESINKTITDALRSATSKAGGSGYNYPDVQLLLVNNHARRIPVMVEAKGLKGKLEKLTKDGHIEGVTYYAADGKAGKDGEPIYKSGDLNYSSIMNFAVNGAVHYAKAILDSKGYTEVIAIGINGSELNEDGSVKNSECKAYYISDKNNGVPKHIKELDKSLVLLKSDNIDKLYDILDKLVITEKELEYLTHKAEATLEEKVKSIHQSLYENERLKTVLTTNEKLYLFCGLIMACLKTEGVAPIELSDFKSNDDKDDNDGTILSKRIKAFLKKKNCSDDKVHMICGLLNSVFAKEALWKPVKGESVIKNLYNQVKTDNIPCLESNLHLDFTGNILNSLTIGFL